MRLWILFSTLLVASGWLLSACHALNQAGYGAALGLGAVAFVFWRRKSGWHRGKTPSLLLKKFKRRFQRPAPRLFLVLAIMAFVGGALYLTQDNDSNEYRIPRVWHWLAANQWHWIRTLDFRMNVAGCNYEWLVAPLMLFTRHDRFLFLPNWISFLMLPGLIFSVFTRLNVRPRVAWWWMWLLASGWCYVIQASSDVNDSFAVIYALAAVDFALRAREKPNVADFCFSVLAAGLLSGSKQTDLPLLLPWLIAILPSLGLMKRNVVAALAAVVIAGLVSVLPLSYFNLVHTGSWMGKAMPGTPPALWKLESQSSFWGFVGNLFCLPAQNLLPPIFPFSGHWNAEMQRFLQTPLGAHFRDFENFGWLGKSVNEGTAGIGLLVCVLALVSIVAARFYRRRKRFLAMDLLFWVRWSGFVSLFVFMCKVVTFENARQCAAYYVFLFPAILASDGQEVVARKSWWRRAVPLVMVLTAGMISLSRNRPLFPAVTLLTPIVQKHPHWHWAKRMREGYMSRLSVAPRRNVFKEVIPADEKTIGYATVRGAEEPGQWEPFGFRRVVRVLPNDSPAELEARGIHFVLVDSRGLGLLGMTIGDWTNRFDGTMVDSKRFETAPGATICDYLVRLNASKVK